MANITVRPTNLFPNLFSNRDPFRSMVRDMLNWEPTTQFTPDMAALTMNPPFDVKETKDNYLLKADLPGFKEGDVEIHCQGDQITVRGKRDQEKEEKGDTYYNYERSYGSFTRSFALPGGVDAEHSHAELKDGVLTVAIPKKPELQAKKIAISTTRAKG